jgi:Na+/H+-dicarboxylate symporter
VSPKLGRWKVSLLTKIFVAMILGVILGLALPAVFPPDPANPEALDGAEFVIVYLKPVGDLFLRLIRMVVVPLVFASLLVGTASLGDPKKLGRIGMKTIGIYLVTTALAITIGLVLANAVQPGSRIDQDTRDTLIAAYAEGAAEAEISMGQRPGAVDTLLAVVPTNPVESLARGDMLQIIFFAMFFGIALTLVKNREKADQIVGFFDGVTDAMIVVVHVVMELAPYGVLALIAAAIAIFGVQVLLSLLIYSLCVFAGLLLHMTLVYSTAVWVLGGISPLVFFRGIRPAQAIAFATSTSSGTLPVTMECAEKNLGVSEEISSFVLPLGSTVNMDGTALYQGVATVFIAQVFGYDLTLGQQLTIVLMATLASIGAAGVPGVGIITLAMVLETLGLPLEGIALILGVDRILDMMRTTVNVTGDAAVAVIVARSEGLLSPPAPGAAEAAVSSQP